MNAESEVETMQVDTGQWRMTLRENASLKNANAVLVEKNRQITNAFKRMIFTALGEMPAEWIDSAMSNLIARAPKKGKT